MWSAGRVLRLVTALFLGVLGLGAASASSQPALPIERSDGIRMLVAADPATGKFLRRGTAFHVGDGVFYTSAHVVAGPLPSGYHVWYLAGRTATYSMSSWTGPAAVACVHKLWQPVPRDEARAHPYDVATVRVYPAEGILALKWAVGRPQVGQPVSVVGFPGVSRAWPPIMYVASGRITAIDPITHEMQIDIEAGFVMGGSSGSPVLNDRDEVLGIIHAGEAERGSGPAGRIFAIHLEPIRICR